MTIASAALPFTSLPRELPSADPLSFSPVSAVPAAIKLDPLSPTIFHERWWLDIVTDGAYDVVEVQEHGKTVGRLPYFLRKRAGLQYSIMPPMTHFLGPAITPGAGPEPTQFLRRAEITRALINKLPEASIYQYKCHRDVTDAIAFQQEGFNTGVQFTYEVAPAAEDVLWKNFRGEKRKKIRSAMQSVTVGDIFDPLEFWHLYEANLQQKQMENVCEKNICCGLMQATLERGQGRIYAARDNNTGRVVAAVYCIWDKVSCFYFMSTRTKDAHQGAISLLAWEAMKDAASRKLIFDFDGLNNSKAVLFFTEFGGVISPRYVVTKQTLPGRLALAVKDMRRESRYFF